MTGILSFQDDSLFQNLFCFMMLLLLKLHLMMAKNTWLAEANLTQDHLVMQDVDVAGCGAISSNRYNIRGRSVWDLQSEP